MNTNEMLDQAVAAANQGDAFAVGVVEAPKTFAVATPIARDSRLDSDDDIQNVDIWVKANAAGVMLDKTPAEQLNVLINLAHCQRRLTITYGPKGAAVSDLKRAMSDETGSYGISGEANGRPWREFVADVQKLYPHCSDSKTIQMIMTTVDDISHRNGDIDAGTVLGNTLSTSSYNEFAGARKKAAAAGGEGKVCEFILSGKEIKGKTGFNWSLFTFQFVRVVE